MKSSGTGRAIEPSEMSRTGRLLVLAGAFLGWLFAGTIMSLIPLTSRPATRSLLGGGHEGAVGQWFSVHTCAFLLGAAAGGLVFGWLGDRLGRSRAMGFSILCYGIGIAPGYLATSPLQLALFIFISCLGVGGMWPNGVALVSEAWPRVSRPTLAGLIGTAANLGFMLNSWITIHYGVTVQSWRWMMIVGMVPGLVLGIFVLLLVPESPGWLAGSRAKNNALPPVKQVFTPPLLKYTLLGIALGTIPMMGNWGSANWTVPWADKVAADNPAMQGLKGEVQWMKSAGGALGALCGGWVATLLGRRTTYFVISLISLGVSTYIFRYLTPIDPTFTYWVFAIGFFGTLYFGWLPLFLPELFPTSARATGTGVSFNFGRVLTAAGAVGTGQLMRLFDGQYERAGQVTCLIYLFGMILILFAPDTSRKMEIAAADAPSPGETYSPPPDLAAAR